MTGSDAFFGAVGNYFSVWIFCLMQIIPFFLALIVGFALGADGKGAAGAAKQGIFVALLSLLGFILIFVAMGVSGAPVAAWL
ncbi:MAG: hypothetical protein HQK87_00480, partial [Nitrospinae bacterium]|nr:hypothetical protein [Nitrospinota bacterium]